VTFDDLYKMMRQKLEGIVPEIELKYKAELAFEINKLKREKYIKIVAQCNFHEPDMW